MLCVVCPAVSYAKLAHSLLSFTLLLATCCLFCCNACSLVSDALLPATCCLFCCFCDIYRSHVVDMAAVSSTRVPAERPAAVSAVCHAGAQVDRCPIILKASPPLIWSCMAMFWGCIRMETEYDNYLHKTTICIAHMHFPQSISYSLRSLLGKIEPLYSSAGQLAILAYHTGVGEYIPPARLFPLPHLCEWSHEQSVVENHPQEAHRAFLK